MKQVERGDSDRRSVPTLALTAKIIHRITFFFRGGIVQPLALCVPTWGAEAVGEKRCRSRFQTYCRFQFVGGYYLENELNLRRFAGLPCSRHVRVSRLNERIFGPGTSVFLRRLGDLRFDRTMGVLENL
ncbi:hypothetical protein Pla52o_41230 [Novipirellula galeiformis]|uniref:Uncharacterized protein n=1 Tax=Novipirellula galeiformis TaxID=2528004 RepID=A0A5C6C929_9BACT|nr:hypothetical protein Pla52o_41230 [Novipirellula galeiformis]